MNRNKIESEANFFTEVDNRQLRSISWSSIGYFQQQIGKASNLQQIIATKLGGRDSLRGLSLAGGDMTGEYKFLRKAGVKSLDAFDISEGQREKFFSRMADGLDIEVNYYIEDVNAIKLKENYYDIVYVQQAYHHFEAIEHVAREINKALTPDGLFVLIDYVGPNFLQRSEKQKRICRYLWQRLPEKYRRDAKGMVREEIHIPLKESLSPFEAIRAEEILETLTSTFNTEHLFLYSAILFPLINAFAHNYDDSEEDQNLIKKLWELDRLLIECGLVEPNFVRAIFTKRQ